MSRLSSFPPGGSVAPSSQARKKVTLPDLLRKKQAGEAIIMLTAYDFPTAMVVDDSGADIILVGDSLGMVVLGYPTTVPVTMEEMLHHCRAVSRGARFSFLVGDMPFMSYQVSPSEAVRNAGRFLKEAGMEAVKLEGGRETLETVRAISESGIPVMGHLGLTPQSVGKLGGFRPQAQTGGAAAELAQAARLLQNAGCFAIVLESVPDRLSAWVKQDLDIPVIGIGAGLHCDGQVLVSHDILGLMHSAPPRFAREYVNLRGQMMEAFSSFARDVRQRSFPGDKHSVGIPDEEWNIFLSRMDSSKPRQSR